MNIQAATCSALSTVLATALVAASMTVKAEEQVFVESVISQDSSRPYCAELDSFGVGEDCTRIDGDWRLRYQMNRAWGVETMITDLGQVQVNGKVGERTMPANVEARGFGVAFTRTLMAGKQYQVYGKLGSFNWAVENGVTGSGEAFRVHDGEVDLQFGVGARFQFNKRVSMRFDWEKYGDLGGSEGRENMERISAKMQINF